MLSTKIQDAINEQIKNELYSAYLYLAMSAYFETQTLPGFAKWMRAHAQEEQGHALRFFDYVVDRGGRVILQAIPQPPSEWASPLDVFEKTLEHEQKVTAMINKLHALAVEEKDYASQIALQWFITEQVEEEKTVGQILEHLKKIGPHAASLIMYDGHLGEGEVGS